MNIAIDSGNSFTKIGIFIDKELKEIKRFSNDAFSAELIGQEAEKIIVSSVSNLDFEFLATSGHQVTYLNNTTPVPVVKKYKTPETLGSDRLAAVTGALTLFPGENCLVLNAGTCLTTDFLNYKGEYLGGSISPGINLRFKTLNTFTARLPFVSEFDPQVNYLGVDTVGSVKSGVLNGIIAEAQSFINHYTQNYPGCKVILTGGDSNFFETNLKGSIFAMPELILLGLNTILEYNVKKQ